MALLWAKPDAKEPWMLAMDYRGSRERDDRRGSAD